ncbi:MAG: hypothetical protein ACJ8G3_04990 [Burkholderiaceae bacterium]
MSLLSLLGLGQAAARILHDGRVAGSNSFALPIRLIRGHVDLMVVAARYTCRTCLLSHEFSAVSKK